ncbi:MAG: aldo/keto reductase, partial [Myxococcota bacterium]
MTEDQTDRRRFLQLAGAGALATGAAAVIASQSALSEEPSKEEGGGKLAVKAQYRTLGRTGKKVSKIGVGTGSLTSSAVLDRAIDLGLNYIDTAHCYMDGLSEKTLGKVLKRRRDEVVLTTKWHPGAKAKRSEMLKSLDESLKRLQCDHVDCVLVHSVGSVNRIRNPEVFEAFEIAKKAGKVSHLGMSSHSPKMVQVLREAIRLKKYEIVLIKYSYMAYPEVGKVIDELYNAGIAVTVMKTRDGARHANLKAFDKGDGFVASALRWASSNPKIASTVLSAKSFNDVEMFAKVAGQALSHNQLQHDVALLDEYARTFDHVQCRWCGECESACPSGVKVWEVDRASMYYERYGEERRGMGMYASLGMPAHACTGCAAPCESAC